ncbi:MAG: FTR1 family protein [Bdellovibrionales bacterium]|nr:FTR1 family protein [Bdellovibrionales bacterium]
MISFGIVVFREVLEISLVLGIILAGTQQVANRWQWIGIGLVMGILGSLVVAVSTDQISELMEGMGQEVFNASVLILASVLIGSTVVWMKHHARQISKHLTEVGEEVTAGARPLSVLALVIALTVLRDGSEIVLLAQGLFVTAGSVTDMLIGGIGGLVAGTIVGLLMYLGIIRASARYIFAVTSWLLIFLCAGMMSQGIALLASADILPMFSAPLWDSSWLLHEGSLLGQTLHTMFGYSSRPSGLQLGSYLLTILVVASAMYLLKLPRFSRTRA